MISEFSQAPFINELEEEQIKSLLPTATFITFKKGENILNKGESAKGFFIIIDGQVDILVGDDGLKVHVATLNPRDFFGEMSCLTGEPISATVQATSHNVQTIQIEQQGMQKLIDYNENFRNKIIGSLVTRIKKSNERVVNETIKADVMTQNAHKEGINKYIDLQGISVAINKLRHNVNEASKSLNPHLIIGENGTGKSLVAGRIHYLSNARDQPFIKLDSSEFSWEHWQRQLIAARNGTLVLRKAEQLESELIHKLLNDTKQTRIILTATVDLAITSDLKRIFIPPLRERKEDIPSLVKQFLKEKNIQHPEQAISSESIRKLSIYPYISGNADELKSIIHESLVHAQGEIIRPEHVRLGGYRTPGTRPKIGLALGSGAVRGCAHVGVLKVLEEENIPIDFIAGSSVGSLIGGLYAAGLSLSDLEELLENFNWLKIARLSLSKGSFVHNKPMHKWLERKIGNLSFSDLKIPFSAVATDALTGQAAFLKSGSVIDAIRASTAIPIMMQPVERKGRTLIDGGLVHRVPVALARSMGADLVIAVDVDIPTFSNGPAKNLVDSIMNTIYIMNESLAVDEMDLADIVVSPKAPVSGYSFKNAQAFFAKGEEETRSKIKEIHNRYSQLLSTY